MDSIYSSNGMYIYIIQCSGSGTNMAALCDCFEVVNVGTCWVGSGHDLVIRVLYAGCLRCRGFDPHTGHDSLLKFRLFYLPQFATEYSAANEYQHCWERKCDGLYNCRIS